jgi:predicted DNA-binding protein
MPRVESSEEATMQVSLSRPTKEGLSRLASETNRSEDEIVREAIEGVTGMPTRFGEP